MSPILIIVLVHLAVKPDPPERVTATPIRFNPRRLEVSWHSPATWPDIDNFPLKYFLRYRPLIRDQWQHVSSVIVFVIFIYHYIIYNQSRRRKNPVWKKVESRGANIHMLEFH